MNLIHIQPQPIRHRHKQRLAQTQRRAQRTKGESAAFVDQQHTVGEFRHRREVAVGEDQGVGLLLAGEAQAMLGFLRVGHEADGDDQIVGAHAAHLLAIAAAQPGN